MIEYSETFLSGLFDLLTFGLLDKSAKKSNGTKGHGVLGAAITGAAVVGIGLFAYNALAPLVNDEPNPVRRPSRRTAIKAERAATPTEEEMGR